MSTFSYFQQAIDKIQEQHSSFRDSLLLSPYCGSYRKKQEESEEDNMLDYIKPHLKRTQTKKMRKGNSSKVDSRKKTEPDHHSIDKTSSDESLQRQVEDLKKQIDRKNQKIAQLEKALSKKSKATLTTMGDIMDKNSPHKHYSQNHFTTENQQQTTSEHQIKGLKKQIIFLTHNNQELFEEVKQITSYAEELRRVMKNILQFGEELQKNLRNVDIKARQLEEENAILLHEKNQMMQNYEEQVRLFRKMKKVWEANNCQEVRTGRVRSQHERGKKCAKNN